jgi:putative holliday junction resolvase
MLKAKKFVTLLGLDFGMRKIGVAIGQVVTKSATPLDALKAQDGKPNWDSIRKIIDDWAVEGFVVGIPYNMDGSEQPMTQAARTFANTLQSHFHLPVFLMDERLTTKEAKSIIQGSDQFSAADLDSIAAKLILESWLRENT